MALTDNEKNLINELLRVTELYKNMTHDQQLFKLREITKNETYPVQAVEEILDIKRNTAQSYFKHSKQSKAGYSMGTKMPLEAVCKLCLHYNKSLEWFLI